MIVASAGAQLAMDAVRSRNPHKETGMAKLILSAVLLLLTSAADRVDSAPSLGAYVTCDSSADGLGAGAQSWNACSSER